MATCFAFSAQVPKEVSLLKSVSSGVAVGKCVCYWWWWCVCLCGPYARHVRLVHAWMRTAQTMQPPSGHDRRVKNEKTQIDIRRGEERDKRKKWPSLTIHYLLTLQKQKTGKNATYALQETTRVETEFCSSSSKPKISCWLCPCQCHSVTARKCKMGIKKVWLAGGQARLGGQTNHGAPVAPE